MKYDGDILIKKFGGAVDDLDCFNEEFLSVFARIRVVFRRIDFLERGQQFQKLTVG